MTGRSVRSEPDVFVKHRADAPEGFFAAEAAGLAWLGAATADGGAAVVDVVGVGPHELRLRRLHPVPPTAAAAEHLGRALAVTHRSGAAAFGRTAPGSGGLGWIGPLPLPADEPATGPEPAPPSTSWGPFFADRRLLPFLRQASERRAVDADGERVVRAVCDRLAGADPGLTGPPEPVARLHGDLWSGNVMWTAAGAVLVDPSAHGGHRESDLAMLALFGLTHLRDLLAGYDAEWPLGRGWQRRVPVHQLHPLLVHTVLFGGGYAARAVAAARRCLAL